jgi:hypothetical protein
MSCNLTSDCRGSGSGGCFARCCNVSCPPDGLCDYIEMNYKAGSNTPGYPCSCSQPFIKKIFEFFTKPKQKTKNIDKIKESDLESNSKLGIEIPPIPSFELGEDLIKTNFVFAQGCSVPCANISVRITTSNSCGISLSGQVGGSKCCCSHGSGKAYASYSGGGDCSASITWTEIDVRDGESIGFPQVTIGNSCCSIWHCETKCGSSTPLWKNKVVGNKLKITLNKKEFAKRVNKMKEFRINSRNASNARNARKKNS